MTSEAPPSKYSVEDPLKIYCERPPQPALWQGPLSTILVSELLLSLLTEIPSPSIIWFSFSGIRRLPLIKESIQFHIHIRKGILCILPIFSLKPTKCLRGPLKESNPPGSQMPSYTPVWRYDISLEREKEGGDTARISARQGALYTWKIGGERWWGKLGHKLGREAVCGKVT